METNSVHIASKNINNSKAASKKTQSPSFGLNSFIQWVEKEANKRAKKRTAAKVYTIEHIMGFCVQT